MTAAPTIVSPITDAGEHPGVFSMDEHALRVLEFDKVIEITAGYAASEPGKRSVRNMRPMHDRETVGLRLQETREVLSLLSTGQIPPLDDVHDIGGVIGKLGAEGIALTPRELVDTAATLAAGRRVRTFFERCAYGSAFRPGDRIRARAMSIQPLREIESAVAAAIDERAEVRDSASPGLRRIRKHLIRSRDEILSRLSSMLQDSGFQKIIREPVITIRDDRYVLPLKPNFRQNLNGVVHGLSGSRATLFVEPFEVLEHNNRLAELRIEEREEIERILRALTDLLARERASIAATFETLAFIDEVRARARFGIELHGVVPEIADGKRLLLRGARHPLLVWKRKNDVSRVAPNDLELRDDERVLILSGPNAGGKTVMLKTVGLLCLMAQAGLPVTASEGTALPFFSAVFADIGDEQSIEQDLSTFSSHVRTIAAILRDAGPDSLVLLDELASGTDPAEGAGLAAAVLERLIERGCLTLATTHHNALKLFGAETRGAVNAAMEFDPATLEPTYSLIPGRPGRSYGLDMAARIGIPDEVIRKARNLISEDDMRLENLLKQVEQHAELLSAERSALAAALAAAERDRDSAEAALQKARTEAREIRDAAKRDARDIIAELRSKLKELSRVETLERTAVKREASRVDELRMQLDSDQQDVAASEATVDLRPGDRIRIPRWNKRATVMAAQRGMLHLDVDGKKLTMAAGEVLPLEPANREKSAHRTPGWSVDQAVHEGLPDRLNIVGFHIEEGLAEVERFLDQACVNGLSNLTIIHGLGTGALKAAVTEYLKQQPLVASIRPGAPAEGGAGVTVAELKQ
jgi:DNA mismatch repair protein MutS2